MGDKNSDQSIMDKSMRSVFGKFLEEQFWTKILIEILFHLKTFSIVGNIPYEATEEKLKDIFSEVGPVITLKLVFDRESGKPKGKKILNFLTKIK